MKQLITILLLNLSYFSFAQCDSMSYEMYGTFNSLEIYMMIVDHNNENMRDLGKYSNLDINVFKYNKESAFNPNIEQWTFVDKAVIKNANSEGFNVFLSNKNPNFDLATLKKNDNIKLEWKTKAEVETVIDMAGTDTNYFGHSKCNKRIGEWRYYYPGNKLKSITHYNDNGNLDGPYKIYHKEGGYLYETGFYKNGKLDGTATYYFPNGDIKKTIPFVADRREGEVIKYYENGQKQYVEQYKNGKICCVAKDFYENGNQKIITYYKMGKIDSVYTYFHENGTKKAVIYYDKGRREGPATLTYENGQLQEQSNFSKDKYDGAYITYYENGQLKAKGQYKKGKKSGQWVEFYENGKKKSKGSYSDKGIKIGKWKDWDENGKKTKSNFDQKT